MEDIKQNLSKNLSALRKLKNITQMELAEMLNYSDKSISKWECGETVPDIEVLSKIASFYNVTVDYLIQYHEPQDFEKKKEDDEIENNKFIIALLGVSIVWICATILHVQFNIWFDINLWMLYVWAIPISLIVLIVFNSIWGKRKFAFYLISFLIWTLLATIYLQFFIYNIWVLFFIGFPLQVSIVLWAKLKKPRKTSL